MESQIRYNFLISALLCITGLFSSVLAKDYQISYLSVKDGLSQNEVTSIIQDMYGFMWFGTRGGLNRYDGYTFKHFKPERNKQTSLVNPSIERLYQDTLGNIWIGTKSGGYNIYDVRTEKFFTHKFYETVPNRIVSFKAGVKSSMWIGGWTGGLWEIDTRTDSIKHWLGNSRVNSIIQTKDSIIWCGTNDGLRYAKEGEAFKTLQFASGYNEITEIIIDEKGQPYLWLVGWELNLVRFNYKDHTFTQYNLPWDKNNLSPKAYSLRQDKNGDIWVGTWGDGLFRFDTRLQTFEHVDIKPKEISDTTIDFDVILDIYEDAEDDIWIGTDGGGIVKLSSKSQFNTLGASLKNGSHERHVNTVCKDSKQNLWIGTKGSGVFVSEKDGRIEKVDFLPSDRLYGKEGIVVKRIREDKAHNIWVSINEGLYIAQVNAEGSYYLLNASAFFKSPELRNVKKAHSILFDGDNIWFATQQSGLFHYRITGSECKLIRQFISGNENGHLPIDRITTLLLDNNDDMWVGTYKGLFKFHTSDSTFISLNDLLVDNQKPICDIILSTWIDDSNTLWFGTPCSLNKLEKVDENKYSLNDYSVNDGISDDYINGILNDDKGNLWLSTNAGISRFNPKNETFRNYDESDGVGGSNFSEAACFKSPDGTLYFGGFSDLTFFKPGKIKKNKTSPPIVITSFKILNKEVPIEEDGLLPTSINEADNLVFTHRESEFSIEMASLDYNAPQRNQYAYWLEGGDEGLINIGTRRHISFNNLKPGQYTLHLKGTNSNGGWSDQEKSINIKVLPAPWRSWYAVVIYIALIMLVVTFITMISKKQERLMNAAKMQKVLREQEHQINEYKLKFFTNISHEIRTPLTLIMAPVNELLKKDLSDLPASFVKNKMQLVHQHTVRLYNLINQLLEFRKIEAGKIKISASQQDIVEFINEYCQAFDDLADNKKISFKKKFRIKQRELFFDKERISVVLNNLLSNAFKFVGEPGVVEVNVTENSTEVLISISNNGKGIKSEQIKHLFERFYQVPGKQTVGSSGIGLALVKSYVELHNGRVEVESQPNKLTTFTVILPKGKNHFSDDQIKEHDDSKEATVIEPLSETKNKTRSINVKTKGAKVLVVEDNAEVRSYLLDLLSDQFDLLEARDGAAAFDLIIDQKPDIVVSDVMMPRMDGFELCEKVKSNELTSHTPVLLLTAKGTSQDQLFGTKKGADAYVTKPFEPELLIEKIKQLVASRKQLSDKFSQKVVLAPTDAEIKSEEGEFLEKAIKIIEKYMSDSGFDPERLASELAMSTSTFYRKIKKLTKKTPGEFVKEIRLKRAAQYLKETNLTVSEIIENVGYQDIKNFRRNFKQKYDMTPSDFRKENKDD